MPLVEFHEDSELKLVSKHKQRCVSIGEIKCNKNDKRISALAILTHFVKMLGDGMTLFSLFAYATPKSNGQVNFTESYYAPASSSRNSLFTSRKLYLSKQAKRDPPVIKLRCTGFVMIACGVSDAAVARRPAQRLLLGGAAARVPVVPAGSRRCSTVEEARRVAVVDLLRRPRRLVQVALVLLQFQLELLQFVAALVQLTCGKR